jgi:thymidylate kinase
VCSHRRERRQRPRRRGVARVIVASVAEAQSRESSRRVAGARVDGPTIHVALNTVFEALDQQRIAWVVLGAVDELREPWGAVAVLVDAAAAPKVDAALFAAGFAQIRAPGRRSHRFFVAYDAIRDRWIELDIVTDVAFGRHGEFSTPLAPVLLARRRRLGTVPTLGSSDAFWHLLLCPLLSRGDVAEHCRALLRSLASETSEAAPLGAFVYALRPRVASRLPAAVKASDWEAVAELGRELRYAWYLRGGVGVAARSTVRRLERHIAPWGASGGGMSVAILGPDGAGKTTLAEALRSSTPLPARYVYLGVWRQSTLDEHLERIFGARLALRLVTLLSKAVLIACHRRLGRLVLLDRYTCDADLPSDDLDLKGRISAKLVRRTNAEPDLIILLDAPVELMYARKGEHGLDELQVRRDAYLGMTGRFAQMVVIDAEQPPDEVRRQATALLWDRWLRRTGAAPVPQ